jgi:cytidylate kinase
MADKRRVVVAIDGPGGAGKSTLAKRIAARLGFLYIDTGAMYRAVALWAVRRGMDLGDLLAMEQLAIAAQIELRSNPLSVTLNGEDVTEAIRAPDISQAASKVSAIGGVRRALVDKQREMAESGSVVMEGRDIGTVVFPDADVKIYLDAEADIRAARRLKDLEQKAAQASKDDVLRELNERDTRDRTRVESPLMQAPDAVYLDSSRKSIEEVEEQLLKLVRERVSNGKEFER